MCHDIQSAIHISFNGNCKEAMQFYQSCFDGDLEIQLVEEAPRSEELPSWMKRCVLQAILRLPGLMIIGSDLGSQNYTGTCNHIAVYLTIFELPQFNTLVDSLSNQSNSSLSKTIKSYKRVTITDRYNVTWIITLRDLT